MHFSIMNTLKSIRRVRNSPFSLEEERKGIDRGIRDDAFYFDQFLVTAAEQYRTNIYEISSEIFDHGELGVINKDVEMIRNLESKTWKEPWIMIFERDDSPCYLFHHYGQDDFGVDRHVFITGTERDEEYLNIYPWAFYQEYLKLVSVRNDEKPLENEKIVQFLTKLSMEICFSIDNPNNETVTYKVEKKPRIKKGKVKNTLLPDVRRGSICLTERRRVVYLNQNNTVHTPMDKNGKECLPVKVRKHERKLRPLVEGGPERFITIEAHSSSRWMSKEDKLFRIKM